MSRNIFPDTNNVVSAVTRWLYGDTARSSGVHSTRRPAGWAEPVSTLAVTLLQNSALWPSCCVWSVKSKPLGVFERASKRLSSGSSLALGPTFLHLKEERGRKEKSQLADGSAAAHPAHVTFEDKRLHLLSGTGLIVHLVTAVTNKWLCPATDPPPLTSRVRVCTNLMQLYRFTLIYTRRRRVFSKVSVLLFFFSSVGTRTRGGAVFACCCINS